LEAVDLWFWIPITDSGKTGKSDRIKPESVIAKFQNG